MYGRQERLQRLGKRLLECQNSYEAELQRDAFEELQAENGRLSHLLGFLWLNLGSVKAYVQQDAIQEDGTLVLCRLKFKIFNHCGRDKGIPNSWWFNWESIATSEGECLETRCVGRLLVVYVCVSLLSLVDAMDKR